MKIRLTNLIVLLYLICWNAWAQTDSLSVKTDSTVSSSSGLKENLFDFEHSKRFAEYLFKTAQYDYAIEEFQRVLFLRPQDLQAKVRIIEAYQQKEDYFKSVGYFHRFFPVFDTVNPDIQKKGIKGHLFLGEYDTAASYLDKSKLDSIQKPVWKLGIYLLKHDWETADNYYQSSINNPEALFHQFGIILQNRMNIKRKSPFLAGTLSAVVPGLGKVYTKNYGDALIAFLFTGLNAWQAYRGFKKDGIQSVRGWIFGGFALSFYLGNIYGSVKAAKKYNKKIDDDVDNEVKAIIKYNF